MCNPFDLNKCDDAMTAGVMGTVYSRAMAANMRKLYFPHQHLFAGLPKYNPVRRPYGGASSPWRLKAAPVSKFDC